MASEDEDFRPRDITADERAALFFKDCVKQEEVRRSQRLLRIEDVKRTNPRDENLPDDAKYVGVREALIAGYKDAIAGALRRAGTKLALQGLDPEKVFKDLGFVSADVGAEDDEEAEDEPAAEPEAAQSRAAAAVAAAKAKAGGKKSADAAKKALEEVAG